MPSKKHTKILVCLSGGVDSSVAAALLVKQGYSVTVMFAVNYDDPKKQESCWRGDYQDALRVAAKLGIKLLRWDFQREYKRDVLKYMYQEYSAGNTPNPDILCNKFVKFGAWLEKAKKLGFDYIATGHYARVNPLVIPSEPKGRRGIFTIRLLQAKDKNKDQTYFLHQLNQEQLRHVLFPIGNYTKPQVRVLAKKFNLPTAQKEESMGICFVGEVPMREFLKDKIKTKPGKIVDSQGNILGKHDGLAFYTIGQRVGVGTFCHSEGSLPVGRRTKNPLTLMERSFAIVQDDDTKPLFVIAKNTKTNELVVGTENDPLLFKKEIAIKNIHWVAGQSPKFPLKCQVRLRHRQVLQNCIVSVCHSEPQAKNLCLIIKFTKPQRAVTPGQFAVFYKKGVCLGGGVIL